jgi:hypothetical protein
VATEVERDRPDPLQQRGNAKPVRRVASQTVQENDRRPFSRLGVSEPVRSAILRSRGMIFAAYAAPSSAVSCMKKP